MIGVITRSKSCSGTCLNLSTARQPKTSALENAEGAGGRATCVRLVHGLLLPGERAKNTSSRLGLPIEKSASSMPASMSAPSAAFASCGVFATIDKRRALDAALDACRPGAPRVACAASSSRAGSATATCRKPEPVATFSSRLRALGDLLAVIDDGDARGELVGLVDDTAS